ncbi:hypothetical protein RAHE111665_06445 [Rariglobus hedericola]
MRVYLSYFPVFNYVNHQNGFNCKKSVKIEMIILNKLLHRGDFHEKVPRFQNF